MLIGSLCSSDRTWQRQKDGGKSDAKDKLTLLGLSVQAVEVAYGPPSRRANAELLAAFKSPVMQPGNIQWLLVL